MKKKMISGLLLSLALLCSCTFTNTVYPQQTPPSVSGTSASVTSTPDLTFNSALPAATSAAKNYAGRLLPVIREVKMPAILGVWSGKINSGVYGEDFFLENENGLWMIDKDDELHLLVDRGVAADLFFPSSTISEELRVRCIEIGVNDSDIEYSHATQLAIADRNRAYSIHSFYFYRTTAIGEESPYLESSWLCCWDIEKHCMQYVKEIYQNDSLVRSGSVDHSGIGGILPDGSLVITQRNIGKVLFIDDSGTVKHEVDHSFSKDEAPAECVIDDGFLSVNFFDIVSGEYSDDGDMQSSTPSGRTNANKLILPNGQHVLSGASYISGAMYSSPDHMLYALAVAPWDENRPYDLYQVNGDGVVSHVNLYPAIYESGLLTNYGIGDFIRELNPGFDSYAPYGGMYRLMPCGTGKFAIWMMDDRGYSKLFRVLLPDADNYPVDVGERFLIETMLANASEALKTLIAEGKSYDVILDEMLPFLGNLAIRLMDPALTEQERISMIEQLEGEGFYVTQDEGGYGIYPDAE